MSTFLEQMKYGPRRILVTGHFGSGKTEFAVSLAFFLAKFLPGIESAPNADAAEGLLKEPRLALADLDIENPYFRSRERQEELEAAGVKVYSDPFGGRNGSELQVISASVLAPIEDPGCRIIMDTGGDKSGAMVLNQFSRHFGRREGIEGAAGKTGVNGIFRGGVAGVQPELPGYQMLSVVNCNRPGTDTVEKAAEQIRAAEGATGLKISGLISNAHLIRWTTPETVLEGWEFTKKVSEVTGIPVLCACAQDKVADVLEGADALPEGMEIFRIGMYMRDTYLDRQV